MATIHLHVEFSGGLESLFHHRRRHAVALPLPAAAASAPISQLIAHLATRAAPGADLRLFLDAACLPRARDHAEPDSGGSTESEKGGRKEKETEGQEATVRPGILVLINDADWELEGGADARVREGDEVVFVSTLHGG